MRPCLQKLAERHAPLLSSCVVTFRVPAAPSSHVDAQDMKLPTSRELAPLLADARDWRKLVEVTKRAFRARLPTFHHNLLPK